jgi:DnaJ-class molecular chaperone
MTHDMQAHYERLGLTEGATAAEIKAAYHAQLRAFPAHSHPAEFKQVRAAYDALRKAPTQKKDDFFEPKPIEAELDQTLIAELREKAIAAVDVSLEDLILLTF